MGFNPQLKLLEYPGSSMKEKGLEVLMQVGLLHRASDNFQSLSEGQNQLCILARAMLLENGVFFLNEPESALDFPEDIIFSDFSVKDCWKQKPGLSLHFTIRSLL